MTALIILSLLSFSGDKLTLYAVGSLKVALSDVITAYEERYKIKVAVKFGPCGLLIKNIEGGENPDIFASANMAYPNKLALVN